MRKNIKKSDKNLEEYSRINVTKDNLIRVGTKYILVVDRLDSKGNLNKVRIDWSKDTLKDDGLAHLIGLINTYYGYINEPSHTDYKRSINGFFNEYERIPHIPKEGDWSSIFALLEHIFGTDYLDFILDYLQIMYLYPKRNLPIILLESKENITGKSTFGHLLQRIFLKNTISLKNQDIASQFNEYWLNKLVVMVDETTLQHDSVKEMLKNLSTSGGKDVVANGKGTKQKQIPFFGKFVFMSNKEGAALPITKDDTRFAVFKPGSLKEKTQLGESFQNRIDEEIPAFLHYLLNRELVHPDKGRMYFSSDVYLTEQLKVYHANSRSGAAKAIEDFIKDSFEIFEDQGQLSFSANNILYELVEGKYLKSILTADLRKTVEQELMIARSEKPIRYKYFSKRLSENEEYKVAQKVPSPNFVYTFYRENYIESYKESTTQLFSEVQKLAFS